MRRALSLLFGCYCFLFPYVCVAGAQADATASSKAASLSGEWRWEHDGSTFTLVLKQTGNKLSGHHDSSSSNGARVDTVAPDAAPSIEGTVSGNIANVHFKSGYSDARGNATLTLEDGKLHWKIGKVSGGEYWLPEDAILARAGSGEQGTVQPGDLTGVWQITDGMAAGWSDAYQFFADHKFIFHASQMKLSERQRSSSGTWNLEKDKLTLVVSEVTEIVGGAPANDGTEYSDEIIGGKEIKHPATGIMVFDVKKMPRSATGYPSLMLGSTQIWRFSENPFDYH